MPSRRACPSRYRDITRGGSFRIPMMARWPHVHVDEQDFLEVAVLKGRVREVKAFADSVISQRGVRYGSLHVISTESGSGGHRHD